MGGIKRVAIMAAVAVMGFTCVCLAEDTISSDAGSVEESVSDSVSSSDPELSSSPASGDPLEDTPPVVEGEPSSTDSNTSESVPTVEAEQLPAEADEAEPATVYTVWDKPFNEYEPVEAFTFLLVVFAILTGMVSFVRWVWL